MIAKPYSPGNAFPADEVARERITFDKAMIGSCTNGGYDDLLEAALVLRAARGRGAMKVAREFKIFPGSGGVGRQIEQPDPRLGGESIAQVFRSVGGQIRQSWCGPCFGQGPDALTKGQRAITSFNRNWQNRMGLGGEGYLASPAVVAASALLGFMAPPSELGLEWAAGGVRRLSFHWLAIDVRRRWSWRWPRRRRRPVRLTAGMVIDRSVVVRAGSYRLAAPADSDVRPSTIRGENITVDFSGAVLAGGPDAADPDTYDGVGILVDGGRNVTIKNAVVRGYKIAILARRSPDLRVSGNDLSYNWKPRLYSGIEKESLVDWMSYHQNDKDEWLTRGAAIYLADCDRAEIDHNTILQGQNGLMVTRSSGLKIWNNTIPVPVGHRRRALSHDDSTITHNRIDCCVRGYSHGFYNRGQDSAGLLMYEQSQPQHGVAYNSITHGGDGLFLWAGQSTMDTGQGGVERQRVRRQRFQPCRRPTASRRRSAGTGSSPTASRTAGTACGAATATNRSGMATGSRATPRHRDRARPEQSD